VEGEEHSLFAQLQSLQYHLDGAVAGRRFVSADAIPLVTGRGRGSRRLVRRVPEISMFVKVGVGTMLVYAWKILRGV